MRFYEIAYKNFKYNIRKYLSIFLCCSLCITVLQVLLSIASNDRYKALLIDNNTRSLLYCSLLLTAVFMIFFISYAINTFLKSRSKEFALYLILGMLKRDFTRMIFIETSIISVCSLVCGLVFGNLSTFLLYLFARNLFDLPDVAFAFEYSSIILTIAIFSVIFFIQMLFVRFSSNKLQLIEILRQWKKPENINIPKNNYDIILSLAAFFILFFSFFLLYRIINQPDGNKVGVLVFAFLLGFLGIYLMISRVIVFIINMYKKSHQKYYDNLLEITEIYSKISQNKKIIFSATILFVIVIFLLSAAYSILSDVPRLTQLEQPYHIVYANYYLDSNELKLKEIVSDKDNKLTDSKSINFLFTTRKIHLDNYDMNTDLAVISDNEYSEISGKNLRLAEGECLQINADVGAVVNNQFPYEEITLKFGNKSFDFRFKGELKEIFLNLKLYSSRFLLIINNEDFMRISGEIDGVYKGTFNILNYDDWSKTGFVVKALKEYLQNLNSKYKTGFENPSLLSDPFKVASRIEYFAYKRQESILRIFIVGFMGLLFLVCISCVMYFKMVSEINQLKDKYIKLVRIGITKKEFKRIIAKELKVIFFTPFMLGASIGCFTMYIMTTNSRMENIFFINTLMIIIIFFLFQFIYYSITCKKYFNLVFK